MSEATNLWELVRTLRQDQHLVGTLWKELHKESLALNTSCDAIFQTMWINHMLGFALTQVLTHRISPSEWIAALDNSAMVSFSDARQVFEPDLVESYSRFLSNLQASPQVVAEVLLWAGEEGLATAALASDLMSVVYGHCLFRDDHVQFLQVIVHLFSDHITQCSTHKDLFVFEHEFGRIITEYCRQLPDLETFLTSVLRDPITEVLHTSDRYLEFDVSKASTNLQIEECNLVQYMNTSCQRLADISMHFLTRLNDHKSLFPAPLRWLLAHLKRLITEKWPAISKSDLRRPISDVFFRYIISSAFINPDLLGILDHLVITNEIGWYNLGQVIGVLQGCAWIMNRLDTSDYPMRRVVKLMDMKPFVSLIDGIDGLEENQLHTPPVTSLLPGLRRSFHLLSREQLENIIGVTHEACNAFMEHPEVTETQLEVSKVVSVVPYAVIQKGKRNPYSFSVPKSSSHPLLDSPSLVRHKNNKQRSRSMWGVRYDKHLVIEEGKDFAKSHTFNRVPKSPSNPDIHKVSSLKPGFEMPREVIILSLWQPEQESQYENNSLVWQFQLLSEEEFLHDRNHASPLRMMSFSTSHQHTHINNPPQNGIAPTVLNTEENLSQESLCHIPDAERNSVHSWSPDTYNGSMSGEDEEDVSSFDIKPSFTKSHEITTNRLVVKSPSSLSNTPRGRRKGFKSWFNKIKPKRKTKSQPKPRSVSEILPHNRDRTESYTKRVGHITAKYERISEERRKASSSVMSKNIPSSPDNTHMYTLHMPSSVEEFKSLPLYIQLKYKLSVILQNIHIPRPQSSFLNYSSVKCQLIELLEESLRINLWMNDISECGIINEILSVIYELQGDCVQCLLLGVRQDHSIRQEYIKYLSESQHTISDAQLQVNSFQNSIQRSRELEEACFLNFSVKLFLDDKLDKLSQFKKDLEMCETADENCSIVQEYLEDFSKVLKKDSMWQLWPEEDLTRVQKCLLNHLFVHVYSYTFHPNGESDTQRDELFSKHISQLSASVTPQHKLIRIPEVYLSTCPWAEVQKELSTLKTYKSPEGKLQCIVKSCKLLIRSLQLSKCGDPPGADDTFPALVYLLIKANPPNLLSTEQYIKNFYEIFISGEDAYWWTQFCSGIGFLRTPEFTQQ